MTYGILEKETVENLRDVMELILSHSNNWGMKDLYPEFFDEGLEIVKKIDYRKVFEKNFFEQINNWICAYANAFDENDLAVTDTKLYTILMDYTTNVPCVLAYDNDDILNYCKAK